MPTLSDSPAPESADRRRAPTDFDAEAHRAQLLPLLRAVEALEEPRDRPLSAGELEPVLRLHPKDGRGFFSRSDLIAGFRHFRREPGSGLRLDEAVFARRVQRRPVRTQSGVTPLTVLTKPFPCPGRCVFCPNDVRMPKSYLSDEPGAQRAANNRFDPYLQTWNRLSAFDATGHPVDKVELIVLGGTWSFYPEAYQVWFVMRCLEAMEDFGAGRDRRGFEPATPDFAALPQSVDGRRFESQAYNRAVTAHLKASLSGRLVVEAEEADWPALEAVQARNEHAACRCVGLVLETRPDHVSAEEVLRLRRLGATKIQLGLQSLSDDVLAANQRGHTLADSRRAMGLLRRAGFKLHAHWMPNLLGSTPEADLEDFDRLFGDADFRPDELKLYPCSLIETAELMQHYERGEWRPYERDELLTVVAGALEKVPRWCRVTRVIRDISSDDIVVGNKLTNFRQLAERSLRARGVRPVEIRSREIKGDALDPEHLELRATEYATGVSDEIFLEFVTPEDRIAGFLRLSLPRGAGGDDPGLAIDELAGAAIVRELHVYGGAVDFGERLAGRAQHLGLGRRLLEAAAERAEARGYLRLSVISALGTRGYYRAAGFADGVLYQHRRLEAAPD